MVTWVQALKIYNKDGPWCIPRKGTPEHAAVKKIMEGGSMPKKVEEKREEKHEKKLKAVEKEVKVEVKAEPKKEVKHEEAIKGKSNSWTRFLAAHKDKIMGDIRKLWEEENRRADEEQYRRAKEAMRMRHRK